MAYISKAVKDRLPQGPVEIAEYDVAGTFPIGAAFTTVALGGATNNCGYLALLRGENGDGLGNPVKLAGSTNSAIAYFNQTNIAAPSPLLGQFSEFGNWTANTNLFDPLIKTTSLTPVNAYAAFDKNGVCLGINTNSATAAALPGMAKLVTIWARPVFIDDVAQTALAAPRTVNITLSRNAQSAEAGANILRFYPYSTAVNANDRVGTAGKA